MVQGLDGKNLERLIIITCKLTERTGETITHYLLCEPLYDKKQELAQSTPLPACTTAGRGVQRDT